MSTTQAEFPEVLHTQAIGGAVRHRVTVAQWDKRPDSLVDEAAYWFAPYAEECGNDPWAVIDGIDAHTTGGRFDVWFASGQCVTVEGSKPIYVGDKHIVPLLRHLIEIDMHADSDIRRVESLAA